MTSLLLSSTHGKRHHIWSLYVTISKHMLKMALQPLREPKQITAKQSADFLCDFVYSHQNHVDTYFSNKSGTRSHKWVWRQTPALKYDVDFQKASPQTGQTNPGKLCDREKRRRRCMTGEKEERVRGRETLRKRNRGNSFLWIWVHYNLGRRPLTKNKDMTVD